MNRKYVKPAKSEKQVHIDFECDTNRFIREACNV